MCTMHVPHGGKRSESGVFDSRARENPFRLPGKTGVERRKDRRAKVCLGVHGGGIGKGAFIYFFPRNFVFKFLVGKGERALLPLLLFCKFSGRGREGGGPWALPAKFFGLGISGKKKINSKRVQSAEQMFAASQRKGEKGQHQQQEEETEGGKAKEFPLSIVRKCDNNASRCSSRSFPPFVGLGKGGRKLLLPLYFFFLPFFLVQ